MPFGVPFRVLLCPPSSPSPLPELRTPRRGSSQAKKATRKKAIEAAAVDMKEGGDDGALTIEKADIEAAENEGTVKVIASDGF